MNPVSLFDTLRKPVERIPGEFVPLWFLLTIVLIIVLVVVLNKLIFKPFQAILTERENEIEGAKLRAQELKTEAEDLLERYTKQKSEVIAKLIHEQTEIVRQAREEEMRILDEGMKEARRVLDKSKHEIRETIAIARADLEKEIPSIVEDIVAKLIPTRG